MKLRLFLYLTLLFIFIPTQMNASFFTNLSVKKGLSNRKVYAIAKDYKGYLWFACRTNIDKYNGERFIHYNLPQRSTTEYERPRGIITTPKGRILTFSDKHIFMFSEEKDAFIPFLNIIRRKDESIITISYTNDGILWIGTNKTLYYILPNKKVFKFRFPFHKTIYSITAENNYVWIGTSNGMMKLTRMTDSKFKYSINTPLTNLDNSRIQYTFYDKKTKLLWIGTFTGELIIYNVLNNQYQSRSFKTSCFPIRKIINTNSSTIWVGVDGGGIYEFDRYSLKLRTVYSQTRHDEEYIATNGIYDIMNEEKHIWVCTFTSGIFVYNKSEIITKIYQNPHNNHLPDNEHINSILEDSYSNLWFGTDNGFRSYNVHNKSWKYYPMSSPNSVVLCIYEDKQKNIWIGGYANRLIKINKNGGKLENINITRKNGDRSYIYSIYQDENNTIWLGGIIDGLTNYNPFIKQTKEYNIKGIHQILGYGKDSLIIATNKGICFFDIKRGIAHPINIIKSNKVKTGFKAPANCLCIDPTNPQNIWIGTDGDGIYLYIAQTRGIKRFGINNGLSSNNICGMQFDIFNRLWITTENGLNCFNPQNNQINIFRETDGIPNDNFNYLALTTCRNGNMILGTADNAIEITPNNFDDKRRINFNIHFESLSIFYNKVNTTTYLTPLKDAIDNTKDLTLKYNQNSFTLDFININYFNHSNILYSWKLEGFDKEWSKPSEEHKAIYTNIPPGNYTFHVKVMYADSPNICSTREINIHISPPFWKTWWAYCIYTIIIFFIIKYIIKSYRDHLDAKDSEQKIRFFTNVAHDIRTPLTLIKAPLTEIENEHLSAEGKHALQLANKNMDRLMNMMSQLIDFQKLESEAMSLHIEKTDFNRFCLDCTHSFQILAKEKQIKFKVEIPETEHYIWIDRKKIMIIFDNLLSNAIKYTQPQGTVCFHIDIDKQKLTITVSDNGIGISANDQKKIFNRFYRAENATNSREMGSGIGLMFTKRLITLHKGYISFTSKEKVGTVFTVNIPINKEDYTPSEIVANNDEYQEENHSEDKGNNGSKTTTLLLVEDNEELRKYLVHYLGKKYNVIDAPNGLEALNIIKVSMPDFILSDVLMPIMSGIELCQSLKSNIETCHIPLILLTSLNEKEDVINGLNVGADDYMTKPFDLSILESRINSIVKNRILYRKKYIDKSAFSDDKLQINGLDKKFMLHIVEYIEEQMSDENFNIDSLAMEMAMSRSVFYKKIKSLTGQNPQEFIRDLKMKKAVRYIREKKYSISEIAYLIGFPNAKYFSTAFKKYYGESPSSFIEKEK